MPDRGGLSAPDQFCPACSETSPAPECQLGGAAVGRAVPAFHGVYGAAVPETLAEPAGFAIPNFVGMGLGRALDVAARGDGWLTVQMPDGSRAAPAAGRKLAPRRADNGERTGATCPPQRIREPR